MHSQRLDSYRGNYEVAKLYCKFIVQIFCVCVCVCERERERERGKERECVCVSEWVGGCMACIVCVCIGVCRVYMVVCEYGCVWVSPCGYVECAWWCVSGCVCLGRVRVLHT